MNFMLSIWRQVQLWRQLPILCTTGAFFFSSGLMLLENSRYVSMIETVLPTWRVRGLSK